MTHVSYANPVRITYKSAVGAFGGTTVIETYVGPKGRRGLVRDIEVELTVDAVGTTAVPEIDVGTASGLVEYGRFRLGTTATAGNTAAGTPLRAASLVTGNPTPPTLSDYAGHVALETAFIPVDTPFVITGKAGVGTPAGTGYYTVTIDWF